MTGSTNGDKRDYSVDNDAMQAFECELFYGKWTETAETDIKAMNEGKFGRPFVFPDSMIEWGMMYRAASKKNYRRVVGAVNFLLEKEGYAGISLTQFYDRAQSLAEKSVSQDITDARVLAYGDGGVEAEHGVEAAVDSTGISLNKYGGWLRHFWNKDTTSGWIKVHVVVNAHTGEILAYTITDEKCSDVTCMERLIDTAKEAGHGIEKIFADAAYDKIELWRKYGSEGIEYRVNIKSSQTKKHVGGVVRTNGCPPRAAHIRAIIEIGRDAWKKRIGYGIRWKVECSFSDLKRMFGDIMRSRLRHRMAAEIYWIVRCYNLYKSIRKAFVRECGGVA
jgi:hypothetical protein